MAPRALGLLGLALALFCGADACTRILLHGVDDSYVLSGRSQDWGGPPLKIDAWILPRGGTAETTFLASNRSITYTPKYGSVVIGLVDSHVTEGINEAGLKADFLNLFSTSFESSIPEKAKEQQDKPLVAATTLTAVILQNFATVQETVDYFRADNITVMDVSITVNTPDLFVEREKATNHMALSDEKGDSAIIEWIDGSPVIYHSRNYTVATNDPTYDKQLSNWDYWQPISWEFLPGQVYSEDRFVRSMHFLEAAYAKANRSTDVQAGVAQLLSFQRGAADPIDIEPPPSAANDASNTQYITIGDLGNKKFYYFSALYPLTVNFVIDLNKIDFDQQELRTLPLGGAKWDKETVLVGDVTDKFVPAELPEWLYKTVEAALEVYAAAK